jgi:hypothetical protein
LDHSGQSAEMMDKPPAVPGPGRSIRC